MKLSVIIPTFNRRSLILQTLPTVLDQTYPANDFEVIIVVDGSTDDTASALRQISSPVRISVVEQENRGQSAARNTGLRLAAGELVLLLDDDLFCKQNLIAEHIASHANGNGVVFGPVLVSSHSPETLGTKWMRSITQDWLLRLERNGICWPADAIVMANSSMRRELLVAMNGFDECFFRALEDVELGLRLWKAGVHFHFAPKATTYQLYKKSTDDLVFQDAPRYGANEVMLCRKHPELRSHSQFANFIKGSWLKRKTRELIVRLPLPLDPLLQIAERSVRTNSKLGIRIFKARYSIALYRSLVKTSGGWAQFERDHAKPLPMLLYHHIGPAKQGTYPSLTVEPARFREQMAWLKRKGYTTVRTDDWLAYCLEGKQLPPKPILLTFDDAYADLVDYAFPVLLENGFTATVFVVTGEIGGSNSWDIKDGSAAISCMSADQIKYWSGQGIEFGAHSRTHPGLATLSGADLEEEIAGSGQDLAQILGEFPRSFAYPFGDYNDAVVRSVEKEFQLAFTCDEGLNGLGTGLHLLRRTMVKPGDSLLGFALRVRFGFNHIDRLRSRVGLRSRLRCTIRTLKGFWHASI